MTDLVISARCNDRRVNYIRELLSLFFFFFFLQKCIGGTEKLVKLFCWFPLFDNTKIADTFPKAILNVQLTVTEKQFFFH